MPTILIHSHGKKIKLDIGYITNQALNKHAALQEPE